MQLNGKLNKMPNNGTIKHFKYQTEEIYHNHIFKF